LIGDYAFDHTPPDVEMLLSISQICSASHTPFIAAAAPTLMNMDTWQELMDPRDLTKLFQTPEYASWRSLRDSEDSRYIGLTMPKTLSRLPYGAKTNPVEDFDFEEDTEGADHAKYCWSNAVYAMGANINRAFKLHGWCARIRGSESGGMVEELPMHTFPTDDGGVDMKCPTEIAITDRREAELANAGLMPLSHLKNTDYAVFVSAQSLHKPQVYDDPEATANDNFASRLPYLFAMCRFAHYLKCIVRDRIGRFQSTDDLTRFLNSWLALFVCSDRNASEHVRAQYPLGQAEIHDAIVDDTSGQVTATFIAWPRFQLEGLTQPLRLRMKFPVLLSQ
jgi:type VI secretion system protein ImpC